MITHGLYIDTFIILERQPYVGAAYLPYYMKFSRRHVNFAILKFAYFATLNFRDFWKTLYFESL